MKSAVWKRYLIAIGIGTAISLSILFSRESFGKDILAERYGDFSDAFFVAGVLLAGAGGLVFVANNGIFDMIKFGVAKAVSIIRSEKHRRESPRTYHDYLKIQWAKPRKSYGFLLITGTIYLLLALLFVFM